MTPQDIIEREEAMKSEALRLVGEASKRNIHLRMLGAIAFQTRCPKFSSLTQRLKRVLSDVDFAGYSTESKQVTKLMKELGYEDEPMVTALWGNTRTIWDNKSNGLHVDIFFDKLEMNHDISFQNRLGVDPLTIPLEEMLMEKMQIVHLEEKDIVDTAMLLREHDVTGRGQEEIDADYIAKLLSSDWGFYYTFTSNLNKVKARLDSYPELTQEDRANIESKVNRLLKVIEEQPKTLAWKLRGKVGPSKKWYRDVEEVRR